MHANAIGSLAGTKVSLNQVLVCPDSQQNLLSVSKLEDQHLDTLFSKGNVYVGSGFVPSKDIRLTGVRSGNSYYVDFPLASSSTLSALSTPPLYFIDTPSTAAGAFLGAGVLNWFSDESANPLPKLESMSFSTCNLHDWHLKFNHLNTKDLLRLRDKKLITGLDICDHTVLKTCEACLFG